jgi:hypothetical protein
MSISTPPALGTIIESPTARKAIYAVYVIALIIAGAAQVGFVSIGLDQPAWLTASIQILGYLGIPVGSLALVNAAAPDHRTPIQRNADRQAKLAAEGQAPE